MMLLSQAAQATGGKLVGADVRFNAVSLSLIHISVRHQTCDRHF